MATHLVKILETNYLNHDVKRFIVEKPTGLHFIPGQGIEVSINEPGWEDKRRPFTFTSLNAWPYLEFIIKIYDEHNGVTAQLGKTHAGAELILHDDVFGSIVYKGPGVFIAGGTGITPFIAIFRDLHNNDQLGGNSLVFSNKTWADVFLHEELTFMLGTKYVNVFTRQGVIGFRERRIDRQYLVETIHDFSNPFYVCGPDGFVKDLTQHLLGLGVSPDTLIIEK